ncbi:hypothetical protein [Peribacillus frigoritolerans]|uniref:hypothetical protein n=1 Tax=Peribacillus frigoritolerans TaxID=450367 RepID=UPI0037F5A7EE
MFFLVLLNGCKKYATLLPNNWLAETPQTLASRRLGRQSAERERISEINLEFLKEKTAGSSYFEPYLKLVYPSCFSLYSLMDGQICDTPAEKLASRDPAGACFDEAWQAVGGKGADF